MGCPPASQEPIIDNELQLISDGDGLAVIGEAAAVERFLISEGLDSKSRDLGPITHSSLLSAGGVALRAASAISASGRWVQLTGHSAQLLARPGNALMTNSSTGLSMGVVQGSNGQIQGIVQFVGGPASVLTNPALLAGAAGIMAQLAMREAMNEIKEYLAVIDAKVDDVLRAQKDSELAKMIGVDFVIDEAMAVRDRTGRVSEVTWSKVQGTALVIGQTQGYVLRQLDALAVKLERENDMAALAAMTKDAQTQVTEWLAVLARCFELQDALAVLELDRVLDASPEQLTLHRLGIKAARQHRLELIARSTDALMLRMDSTASRADKKVLLHPIASRAIVDASNVVSTGVVRFHRLLGMERERDDLEATRWRTAASNARDRVLEVGAEGVVVAGKVGNDALDNAKSVSSKLSSGIAERLLRMRTGDDTDEEI